MYACATLMISLGAMKSEWPPSPEQQKISKPYVKAGIQEMQQEVAREMWERPESNRKELINLYVHSIGFQAVIGQMQENLGLTDDMIIERAKGMLRKIHGIDEATKSQWMPIIDFVYPRLSQLALAKARIYTDNDFDTLVGIASILHENYVKAIAISSGIKLKEPTDRINQQYQLLEKIDKRIDAIGQAIGVPLSMRGIDAAKLIAFIRMKLFMFNQVLKEYPVKSDFRLVSSSYDRLIKELSSDPQIMGKTLSEKLPTFLKNKLRDAVIVAMFRHAGDRNGFVLLFNQKNKNKSVKLINDITDPDLKQKIIKLLKDNKVSI